MNANSPRPKNQKAIFASARSGKVLITKDLLVHTIEKRDQKRERFANFVIPTLKDPYEIYCTQYADGSRRRMYFGLFDDGSTMLAITIMRDGSLLWNVILPEKNNYANKVRMGWMIYGK
ncbi:MAG: hypothetical protein LBN32_01530 [Helicobacteraceae bacterium]|jgi:hypothetical protein|nr:hypothetical protein [Helicobacteraceae bacterium]